MSTGDRQAGCFLDCLLDPEGDPSGGGPHAAPDGLAARTAWRASVVRDIGWLLNAVTVFPPRSSASGGTSVLGFGLPPLAGSTMSALDMAGLTRVIRDRLDAFEPRVDPTTILVRAVAAPRSDEHHNAVMLEIRGELRHPVRRMDLSLRTTVDLETGLVRIEDAAARH